MTQRITSQMIGNTTVASIENDMNQLAQTQEELSTGYQINQMLLLSLFTASSI